MNVIGPLVMATKMLALTFIIYWVRFTYPRFREDQLQTFAWKYLIPISLVNIAVTGLLKVVFSDGIGSRGVTGPGDRQGLGVTFGEIVKTVTQGRGHRPVPPRQGGPGPPGPRRDRPPRGELHGLHAVLP